MSITDQYFEAVRAGLDTLAVNLFKEAAVSARADAEAFLKSSQEKFQRWIDLLAQGAISRDDFEFLVKMQGDIAEMHALKAAGIARQRIERFRRSVVSLLISSAFSLI